MDLPRRGHRLLRGLLLGCSLTVSTMASPAAGAPLQDPLPVLREVEAQPLVAQVQRLAQALDTAGRPLDPAESRALDQGAALPDEGEAVRRLQEVLDRHVLCFVHINPESRVKARPGPARPLLTQGGWSTFLVKVHNEAGVTAPLKVSSPQAEAVWVPSSGRPEPEPALGTAELRDRWLDLEMLHRAPLRPRLSGLALEYCVVQLYARDAGSREATLAFDVGAGSQDLGFRADCAVLFECRPGVALRLEVLDADGRPTTASFLIHDAQGHVVPSQAKRLAPDFFFQPQIYRAHGETVAVAPGSYEIEWRRGPESVARSRTVQIPEGVSEHVERFQVERWIRLRDHGWYGGDHHVHGGGCSHYESPTAGVGPLDMWRQQLGEDLPVAFVLSWGPCWYHQKEYFDGGLHALSTADHLLRYDVEVSGFPSSHCGHLCLLRLKEDDFPESQRLEDWPSWNLPILRWAREQGGVVGYSHSGWGLGVTSEELPNFQIPPYDGIGANEYVVDVTHDLVDFYSAVDTPHVWELNMWYHTLQCGFRTRLSAETDFPCIYDDRVGMGRVYCRLDELEFDAFVDALRDGRSYVSDGKSHLLDFQVSGPEGLEREGGGREAGTVQVGVDGSQLDLDAPGEIVVKARVAARLDRWPQDPDVRERPYWEAPYWELERARLGDSRRVPLEVVVNGEVVHRQEIEADGALRDFECAVRIERSSWVALRILPSSHSNPVFVLVDGAPIRASRRSAQWCLDGVDRCWQSKVSEVRAAERGAMAEAYEHARQTYTRILAECPEER